MLGSSAASFARLSDELGAALDGGADGAAVGDGLLAAATVLRDQVALRRAVTDPTTDASAKSGLATTVFGSKVDPVAARIVANAAGMRWGSSRDLPASLAELGITAIVKGADRAGDGDRVEGELFAFGRTVTESPALRDALSDPARTVADKQVLVASLLEGKACAATQRLVAEALTTGAAFTTTVDEYVRLAAAARSRLVATVRTAAPLSEAQVSRLTAALGREQGSPVHLNLVVDADVVGGIHVEIGDHVVDGSISSRLDDARRRVAG